MSSPLPPPKKEAKPGGGRSRTAASPPPADSQTAAWIKMPLGTEVGLRNIVFDADPDTSRKKGTFTPIQF